MIFLVAEAEAAPVEAIAFGSCLDERKRQPIWRAVWAAQPAAFFFLGDNVYGDSDDPAVLKAAWDRLGSRKDFQRFRESAPVFGTWDDHDYGRNDAGVEFPAKAESRKLFLDFFEEPDDSTRRTQEGGIYTEVRFDEPDGSVQVLLLDDRWSRTSLVLADEDKGLGPGPYLPNPDPAARMLDEAQWAWLVEQLAERADVRLIGSSTPVLPEFTGWETWANFPRERARLLDLVSNVGGAVFLSGDTHWHELSAVVHQGVNLWELGSSGMTHVYKDIADNRNRYAGHAIAERGFGVVRFDWERRAISLEVHGVDGRAVLAHEIGMDGSDLLPVPTAENEEESI